MELHPKAYLINKRNVKAGLSARTKILIALEKGNKQLKEICQETGLSYATVSHHIKLLIKEQVVKPITNKKPYTYGLTEYGQQKLV
ncbi:MAG: winged helix-turn-helix domain-containing protein [Candidatus Bathyarchaeia archaeon]|nr:winged helix-turn-helix transcriptional regulator [Candidatus Bathyarchaeota archaeon]